MPIYEYLCRSCGSRFEKLVRSMSGIVDVTCPQCGGKDCEKALSLFGVAPAGRSATNAASSCAPAG